MINTFEQIFDKVIMDYEGGSRDNESNKNDKGGYTRYGISQFWKEYIDIKNCTEEEVKVFYKEYFFKRINVGYNALNLFLFDSLVQHDVDACIWLQQALGFTGKDLDGVIGTETKKEVSYICDNNVLGQDILLKKVASYRMQYYLSLDDNYSERYFAGWSNRFVDVLSESLKLT